MKTNYPFILNGTPHEWGNQTITIAELKKAYGITDDEEIYLKVQGKDELISDKNPVDLSRSGIEKLYSRKAERYKFIINGKLFISEEPLVNAKKLRELGEIHEHDELFLQVDGPDHKIEDDQNVDLAPFGIEYFYSKKNEKPKIVHITIDNKEREILTGVHSVEEIKKLGHVDPSYDLDQLINEELHPLPDNGKVEIKGCEIFFSHPKDGRSS